VADDIDPGRCPFRMRPFPGFTIIDCELPEHAEDHRHEGALRDYAYPGSVTVFVWLHDDRRTFSGDFIDCPTRGCTLPAGHPRKCDHG